VAGVAALYAVVREMRRRGGIAGPDGARAAEAAAAPGAAAAGASSAGTNEPDGRLKPYIEAVDEELRNGRAGTG
jgi:hypothetical protein